MDSTRTTLPPVTLAADQTGRAQDGEVRAGIGDALATGVRQRRHRLGRLRQERQEPQSRRMSERLPDAGERLQHLGVGGGQVSIHIQTIL